MLTVDNDVSCHLTFGGFLEMIPWPEMFFDLSVFDIQWENRGYSIYQIVQNNDLPKGYFKVIWNLRALFYLNVIEKGNIENVLASFHFCIVYWKQLYLFFIHDLKSILNDDLFIEYFNSEFFLNLKYTL